MSYTLYIPSFVSLHDFTWLCGSRATLSLWPDASSVASPCMSVCHTNHKCINLYTSGCKHACAQVYAYPPCCPLLRQTGQSMNLAEACEFNLPDGDRKLAVWLLDLISYCYKWSFSFRDKRQSHCHCGHLLLSQGCNLNIFVQGPHCLLITHSELTCGFSCQLLSLCFPLFMSLIQIKNYFKHD